jgi:RND family efflux transporter MFP subunit
MKRDLNPIIHVSSRAARGSCREALSDMPSRRPTEWIYLQGQSVKPAPSIRFIVIGSALLLALGCHGRAGQDEREQLVPHRLQQDGAIKLSSTERATLDLAVTPAALGDLPNVVVRFGQVRAPLGEETLVVSPVAGRIPRTPLVALGSDVAAGAPVIEVVPVLAAAERMNVNLRGAELGGQIEAAEHELATQRAALERARELARSNIISQAKLQEAETTVATTSAHVESLRRATKIQSAGEATPITLRAPAAGRVSTLNATVGAVVQQGDLLIRLMKPGPRWVDIAVPPNEPAGDSYEVTAGDAWMPSRIIAPGTVVEADGLRRDRLQVDEPSAAKLLSGQVVSVRIAHGQAHGLVLPESALVPGVQTDLVFIETSPDTFAPTPVRVTTRFGGRVRVASGLKVGDRIVTRGAMSLHGETRRAELGTAD